MALLDTFTLAHEITHEERNALTGAFTLTDMSMAQGIHVLYPNLVYHNAWYLWNPSNRLWIKYDQETVSKRIFEEVRSDFVRQFNPTFNDRSVEIIKKCGSAVYRKNVFRCLQEVAFVPGFEDKLDPITPWIPTNDGKLFHLITGSHRDRLVTDYHTHTINAKYDPEADTSTIDQFFTDLVPENKKRLIEIICWFIGGDLRDKSCTIWRGDGNNGKTTLVLLLMALLGKSGGFVVCGVLPHTDREYFELKGKRLVVNNSLGPENPLDNIFVKQITGGDLTVDECGTKCKAHLIFVTNDEVPESKDRTIHDRVDLQPFVQEFVRFPKGSQKQQDPHILSKLTTPANLDGLLKLLYQHIKECR